MICQFQIIHFIQFLDYFLERAQNSQTKCALKKDNINVCILFRERFPSNHINLLMMDGILRNLFESIKLIQFINLNIKWIIKICSITHLKPLLLILMSIPKTIQQQRFAPPEVSESLPTFRQVGSYMNSIPSVSTIYLDRDNTHTRMDSELKMNSNKPSVDLQNGACQKGESDILSYSSTENFQLEDSLLIIHRLIKLLTSEQNLKRHLLHSLQISGYSCQKASELAKIVTLSLGQYIQLASKVDIKVIREQIVSGHTKIAILNKEMIKIKQENLKAFQKNVKYEEENKKYKDKYFQLKQKLKKKGNSQQIYEILQNYSSHMGQKMMNLETLLLEKLLKFQDSILLVSQFRQKMQARKRQAKVFRLFEDQQAQKYYHLSSQKQNICQSIRSIQQSSKIGDSFALRREIDQKNQEINRFQLVINSISQQLNDQKVLYQAMLDKNISLEKQIYILALAQQKNSSFLQKNSSGDSFCITNQNQDLKYLQEDINSNEVNCLQG